MRLPFLASQATHCPLLACWLLSACTFESTPDSEPVAGRASCIEDFHRLPKQTAQRCDDNPCNPACYLFTGPDDDGGITPDDDASATSLDDAGITDAGAATPTSSERDDRYVYEPTCDDDRGVVWDFLTYEATISGDASLTLRARTATSRDALAGAPFVDLVFASGATAITSCTAFGPDPCPLDLFELLGTASATQDVLELQVVTTTSTTALGTSTLDHWDVRFTCAPDQ